MVRYACKKCGCKFKNKTDYTQHIVTPCVIFMIEEEDNEHVTSVPASEAPTIPKPILKWVGGKTQILNKLIPQFPTNIQNYHEIFVGAGSVLFAVLAYRNAGIITISDNVCAYDVNEPLIHVFKNIQSNHDQLYDAIQELIVEFNTCVETKIDPYINKNTQTKTEAMISRENYYYWSRARYNNLSRLDKQSVLGSALFIFLNKTCFRGIFRMGPNGFNVPYGNNKNPEIINRVHLDQIHELIQGVLFTTCDFTVSMNQIGLNDYAYLDPPYVQENSTSFVGYTENGFNQEQHNELFELCNKLTSENKQFMMSNADVDIVRDAFSNNDVYTINSIECKRSIHSKKPESKAKEVIIKNY
jgi:DNA adenine methylase